MLLNKIYARLPRTMVCAILGVVSCSAATITGTILSNHSGPTADASGMIKIAVANQVRSLYYDQSLRRHFGTDSCLDIGAIWTVEYRSLPDSSLYADRAICDGKVDEATHEAWLVVRGYLAGTDARPSDWPKLFSSRWISSHDGQEYEHQTVGLDLGDYHRFGSSGTCVDVTEARSGAVHLEAGGDCHLVLSGKPVDLVFTVVRDREAMRWKIDRIEIR
jgi:hypothetical protein